MKTREQAMRIANAILLLVITLGCSDSKDAQPNAEAGPSQACEGKRGGDENKANVIVAAQGLPGCRVGMDTDDLIRQNRHTFVEKDTDDMLRSVVFGKDGYRTVDRHGPVVSIGFYFRPDSDSEMGPFCGYTSKGIGAGSTIEDVIHTYGQPAEISNTVTSKFVDPERAGERTVDLDFQKLGIGFEFIDKKLNRIYVFSPDDVYLQNWGDIGDTSEYRAIIPRGKPESSDSKR